MSTKEVRGRVLKGKEGGFFLFPEHTRANLEHLYIVEYMSYNKSFTMKTSYGTGPFPDINHLTLKTFLVFKNVSGYKTFSIQSHLDSPLRPYHYISMI